MSSTTLFVISCVVSMLASCANPPIYFPDMDSDHDDWIENVKLSGVKL
jgi:hypothetical protein